MRGLLFTCQADARHYVLEELDALSFGQKPAWLNEEVGFISSLSFSDAAAYFAAQPPLFIRHICPVDETLSLGEDALSRLIDLAKIYIERMDKSLCFSVQTRFLQGRQPFTPGQVTGEIASYAQQLGYELDVRMPKQVLSIVLTSDNAYIGLSLASQNLSSWAGGAMRFKDSPERVSRAEFKLLEALSIFPTPLSGTRAIDLGAAPGGWTRILIEKGCQSVTAVDPALLDGRVISLHGVTHRRMRAQEFFKGEREYDIMVNDMRMDATLSAALMNEGAITLKPGAPAIITLKLPHQDQARIAKAAVKLLSAAYNILGARQLFHNRSEITVALTRK